MSIRQKNVAESKGRGCRQEDPCVCRGNGYGGVFRSGRNKLPNYLYLKGNLTLKHFLNDFEENSFNQFPFKLNNKIQQLKKKVSFAFYFKII